MIINSKKGKNISLYMIAATGALLSLILSLACYRYEKEAIKSAFNELAAYRFKYIENAAKKSLADSESFSDFYATSVNINRNKFSVFSQGIFSRNKFIFEFRWLPRVKAADQAAFLESAAKEGFSDFEIKVLDRNSKLVIAPQKEEYFPVYYIAPSPHYKYDHSQLLGLDASSIPERWRVMEIARDSGKPAIAEEGEHFGEKDIKISSRIFLPVYISNLPHDTPKERRDNLAGFVVALYRIDEVFKDSLKGIPPSGVNISIYEVFSGGKRLLHFCPPRLRKELLKGELKKSYGISWRNSFKFANHQWLLIFTPSPEFFTGHKIFLPGITLIACLALSALLVIYLKHALERTIAIEVLGEERTEKLHKSEDELKTANEELEIRAWGLAKANEGIKFLYKELEEKNEELKKASQVKTDFVSVVSHELRTPLSIIKEGVSLVLDNLTGGVNEKTRLALNMVFENINRLATLINDLLDISKIEAGKVQLRKTLTDISYLIKDTAEKWKLETDKKEQKISISAGEEKAYVYIDQDKIIQVLNNLISNAIKFTPPKGLIKVELEEKRDEVSVSVSDNGIGIEKEDLPKIFQKFQQFKRPVGAGGKGAGLGLAISKELVAMHEGVIKVESKPGTGTRFTFTIPKKDSEAVFKEHIDNGIKEVSARKAELSLLSVRIQEFPKLQRDVGIDKACEFLSEIEKAISASLRKKADTVVRDTGELIIILFDTGRVNAGRVLQRVEATVRGYLAASKNDRIKELSFNIGIASYPSDAKTVEELLNKAKGIIKV